MAGFVRFGVSLAVLLAMTPAAQATDLSVTPIYQTRPLAENVTRSRGFYLGSDQAKLQDRAPGSANAWTEGVWPGVGADARERAEILIRGFAGR